MSDDNEIDAALRRAMAALDGETPPGYFDALPARTAARLDAPAGPLRPFNDDGGTVYSSQIISLADFPGPEGNAAALPRADRARAMASMAPMATESDARRLGSPSAAPMPSRGGAAGPIEAPARAATSMTSVAPADRRRRRGVRAAGVGLGLAAAGAVIYLVASHRGAERAPIASVTPASGSGSAGGSAAGSGSDTSGVAGAGTATTGSGAAEDSGTRAAPEQIGKFTGSKIDRPDNPRPPSKPGGSLRVKGGEVEGKRPAPAPGAGKTKKGKPSKQEADRTSLSSDDLERAMAAVAGRARACLAGAAASASLRLTVAPSGQIAQVAVTGPLAGTPAGACVERAVRTTRFPPWDGVAQSFDYRLTD